MAETYKRFCVILIIFVVFLQYAASTEVTEIEWQEDHSLDMKIGLPVLACRSKQVGYKEVLWFKDYVLIQSGANHPSDHKLYMPDLLNATSGATAFFDHPLKLQGYYWCETDQMNGSAVHSYLFRMKEIDTYVGKFVSTEDSLGDNFELSLKDKIPLKKLIYEEEMQKVMFGFLPEPNTHVTDITVLKKGLEVRFYVYSRQLFHPRMPHADELIKDKHELESIVENLNNNETLVGDIDPHRQLVDWTNFRGIDIKKIELRSTLGCYEDVSQVPSESLHEVTWPYAYIGEVVIPRDGCSSKNGMAVTRLCTGSFYTGARWGYPSGTCDKSPNKLTSQLLNLYESFGDNAKMVYIEQLQELTNHSEMLTVTDLHIVADILSELSKVPDLKLNEMDGIFSVIDRLVETNRSELQTAKSTIKLTSRLLRIINNLLNTTSQEKQEVLIQKQHILVDTKSTKKEKDRVIGLAILGPSPKESSSVRLLLEGGTSIAPKDETLAYFLLPPELVMGREKETPSEIQTQVSVVFFRNWLLFPNPKGVLVKRHYRVLPSSVMLVSITGGPAWNLTNAVHVYFKNKYAEKIENPVCVQFDPKMEDGEGAWSTEGCEYAGIKNGFHSCQCHHLSIFAVILSERPYTDSAHNFRLGTAVYVGCAASIVALSFTIILFLLSKEWRQSVDHSILFWLSVALLCFIVLLLVGDMKKLVECRVVAVLLHYSVLVVAGWLLVQAVMHRLRFANKTDMREVPHFILKSGLCCWGVPILIMLIIWFTKDYKYKQDSCRRALCDLSRWTLIPIVVFFVVTLWLNVCAVYSVTCRFKQDYLIGNLGYDESVIKFRVALTIYFFVVMSYLFGFFALHKKSRELRILFSISLTLTCYYLMLFFVFQEVSLWEMWAKWKKQRNSKSSGEIVKFVAGKEKYTEETPGISQNQHPD